MLLQKKIKESIISVPPVCSLEKINKNMEEKHFLNGVSSYEFLKLISYFKFYTTLNLKWLVNIHRNK